MLPRPCGTLHETLPVEQSGTLLTPLQCIQALYGIQGTVLSCELDLETIAASNLKMAASSVRLERCVSAKKHMSGSVDAVSRVTLPFIPSLSHPPRFVSPAPPRAAAAHEDYMLQKSFV